MNNPVIQKYERLVKYFSRKFKFSFIGNREDHEQLMWEILFTFDVDFLINEPKKVITALYRKLLTIKRDNKYTPSSFVEYENEGEELNTSNHRKYDWTVYVDRILMKEAFKKRLSQLIRYLEHDELNLLKFYIEFIQTNSGIPTDVLTKKELYNNKIRQSTFRDLKSSLYEKIKNYFKDMESCFEFHNLDDDIPDKQYMSDREKNLERVRKFRRIKRESL